MVRIVTVMGVVNCTPDSFSDGGCYLDTQAALRHAGCLLAEGADWIDIGGASSRPGAACISAKEELARIKPVLDVLCQQPGVQVSVDTCKLEVMQVVLDMGVAMINDITACRNPASRALLARYDARVCLMHMAGDPRSMQQQAHYAHVSEEVIGFLRQQAEQCQQDGIAAQRIMLDPGIGFGKTLAHNLQLTRDLPTLKALGYPVLVGYSRKSMIGQLTGRSVADRLPGSLALAVLAAERGADCVRVHDVAATRDALAVLAAVQDQPDI